jgi:TonB family protein
MTWWHYLLLVNFYLVLFFGFYALLLRRETFFQLNRIYLVAASLLSFIIPLIQADWVKNLFITQEVQHTIYNMPVGVPLIFAPVVETGVTLGQILNIVYISVTLFLLIRLMWQLLVLKKAIEKPTPSAAYTFFKRISLGENMAQSKIIAEHEQVHAGQWHSIDVMIIETVMIINWFNPVVYLYRFAIKYIHEFIADSQVIKAGTDKADYALLLLSQTFDVSANNLVNQFYNHSLLKQRIMMLQKNKSQRIALVKYGLSAPLFILMMIFSSATINNSKAVAAINTKAQTALSATTDDLMDAVTDRSEIPAENKIAEEKPVKAEVEAAADNNRMSVDTLPIYSKVDQMPQFPGGLQGLGKYLGENIKYPADDRAAKLQAKVFIKFVVEADGTLSDIKAVDLPGQKNNASQAMKDEALRVMIRSPKWSPGTNDGNAVRVSFVLPIAFALSPDGPAGAGKPTGAVSDDKENIYSQVDKQPIFPGGLEVFGKYIGDNIKYPKADREKGTQGKVFVSLVVETDGTLSNIKAIRGPSQAMMDEAVRVLLKSPKWHPGVKDGQPVRVSYTVPIAYMLGEEKTEKEIKSGKVNVSYDGTNLNIASVPAVTIKKLERKASGLKTPTSPLYIIDGVVTALKIDDKGAGLSPLSAIPQEDIASIEILKDETAEKLYGDKGKYGVILVTTKNPKKG